MAGHPPPPCLLFDLDGTLIDSVYQHVVAWREALEEVGVELSVWRIHRRIGMSGGLFVNALQRELGSAFRPDVVARLPQLHAAAFERQFDSVRPLPDACDLLAALTAAGRPWGIATSGSTHGARPALELLGLPSDTPMVTRDDVAHAKPDPSDLLRHLDEVGVRSVPLDRDSRRTRCRPDGSPGGSQSRRRRRTGFSSCQPPWAAQVGLGL